MRRGSLRYGVGSGAAHLISGHSRAHQALEEELADFFNCRRVIVFSTGYVANLGMLSTLAGPGDVLDGGLWTLDLGHWATTTPLPLGEVPEGR